MAKLIIEIDIPKLTKEGLAEEAKMLQEEHDLEEGYVLIDIADLDPWVVDDSFYVAKLVDVVD